MPVMDVTAQSRIVEQRAKQMANQVGQLRCEIERCVIGQGPLVDDLIIAICAGGHVLIEGLPGLGKTLLVKSLARALGVEFGRIQFTPDLMPADVLGTRIIDEHADGLRFRFQPGPIFTNLLLADEINRTTPKTQSALLEAMQEGNVTIGDSTRPLDRPFCVVATQNPIELEGTYPLPEAQLDRFLFKLVVGTPAVDDMVTILATTTSDEQPTPATIFDAATIVELQDLVRQVICGAHLLRFVAELLHATHPGQHADADTQRYVRYGASPRAGQAIVLGAKARALLDGRPSVSREDIDRTLRPALRHRIVLTFDAETDGHTVETMVEKWAAVARHKAP